MLYTLYSYILNLCIYWTFIIYYLCNLAYPLFYSFTSSINSVFYTLILSCFRFYLSIYTILFIRFIIPIPSSIFLSLKNLVSKLLIRGMLYPILIWWLLLFLIPFIRSLASKHYTYTIAVIFLLSEIMPIYSCYIKKKLVYIIIITFFGH